jgi:hypothetical protein
MKKNGGKKSRETIPLNVQLKKIKEVHQAVLTFDQ